MQIFEQVITEILVRGDEALDRLAKSYDRATGAAKKADKASDKLDKTNKKTAIGADRMATAFRDMGGVGERLGDVFDMLATLMLGPVGVGIAGVVVGIGALIAGFKLAKTAIETTTDAVLAYVAGNRKAKKASEELDDAFDKLTRTFGRAVVGGEAVTKVMAHIQKAVESLTGWIDRNAEKIFNFFRALAVSVLKVVGGLAAAALSFVTAIAAPIELVFESIKTVAGGIIEVVRDTINSVREIVKMLPGDVAAGLTDSLTDAVNRADQGVAKFQQRSTFGVTKALMRTNANLARQVQEQVAFIAGLGFEGGNLGPGADALSGGGADGGQEITSPTTFIPSAAPQPALSTLGFGMPNLGEIAKTAQQGAFDKMIEDLQQVVALGDKIVEGLEAIDHAAIFMGSVWESVGNQLKAGLAGITNEVFGMLGAFALGEGSLKDFGDAMLDAFGSLATQLASFFFATGTALLFTPGMAGQGGLLLGAAAGLALVGGALSSKGSANRGGGRSAPAADNSRSAIDDISRLLTPRRSDNRQPMVLEFNIDGKRIIEATVDEFDNAVRQRKYRHIQPART